MEFNNELLLGLAATFGSVFVALATLLASRHNKAQHKRDSLNDAIREQRTILDRAVAEVNQVYREMNLQNAICVCYDKDRKELEPFIEKAKAAEQVFKNVQAQAFVELEALSKKG